MCSEAILPILCRIWKHVGQKVLNGLPRSNVGTASGWSSLRAALRLPGCVLRTFGASPVLPLLDFPHFCLPRISNGFFADAGELFQNMLHWRRRPARFRGAVVLQKLENVGQIYFP